METLSQFAARISKDIPCYFHERKKTKRVSLKKCDTMTEREMRLLAAVTELKTQFRINSKYWLASEECKNLGKKGT